MIIQLYGGPEDGAELNTGAQVGETIYIHLYNGIPPIYWGSEEMVPGPEEKVPVACYQVIPGMAAVYRGML